LEFGNGSISYRVIRIAILSTFFFLLLVYIAPYGYVNAKLLVFTNDNMKIITRIKSESAWKTLKYDINSFLVCIKLETRNFACTVKKYDVSV